MARLTEINAMKARKVSNPSLALCAASWPIRIGPRPRGWRSGREQSLHGAHDLGGRRESRPGTGAEGLTQSVGRRSQLTASRKATPILPTCLPARSPLPA
jgi:hypothetical protein